MGDPRYPRKVWRKPKRPLNYDLKMDELKTLGGFGLRTKRELWKARTELSRLRQQARSLLALGEEVRGEREPILINSLERVGLVKPGSSLDDVLNLQVNDVLARRLQSIVMKKMDFRTPYQARQAVVHGHVMIGERIVDIPSYTVTVDEEDDVRLLPGSPLAEVLEANKRLAKEEAARPKAEDGEDEPGAAGSTDPGAAAGLQRADAGASGAATPESGTAGGAEAPKEETTVPDPAAGQGTAEETTAPDPAAGQGTAEAPKEQTTAS